MKEIFHYVLFIAGAIHFQTINSSQSQINRIEHLPTNIKPEMYDVKINVVISYDKVSIFNFRGKVVIKIKCIESTDTIVLNRKGLKIMEKEVIVESLPAETEVMIKSHSYKNTRDLYIIHLEKRLESGGIYNVIIPFIKGPQLVDFSGRGLIQYTYGQKEEEEGENSNSSERMRTGTIVFTSVGINDARRIFPCMDQINMKAVIRTNVFSDSVKKTKLVSSESANVERSYKDGEVSLISEPNDSTPISTFTFGAILGDVESSEYTKSGLSIKIKFIYDPPEKKFFENSFIEISVFKVLEYYISYFEEHPIIETLYICVLPVFDEIFMEKYGVIFLTEDNFLPENKDGHLFDEDKSNIMLHFCAAINEQWIGSATTVSQWNEYWLHAAISTVLRDACFNEVFSEAEPNPVYFLIMNAFEYVLKNDGTLFSRPVHVDENYFDLTKYADSLSSNKEYLIIRMMKFFLGEDTFKKCMRHYYKKYSYKNSTLDQVWNVFQEVLDNENIKSLPKNTSIKEIMHPWISKIGYPLITVHVDYVKKTATIEQERFVQLGDEESEVWNDPKKDWWIIPLSYKTQQEGDVIEWLSEKKGVMDLAEGFSIFNTELNTLCRVNYDTNTRNLIINTLLDKETYSNIDISLRTRLISDMFALAEVEKIPYETLFKTVEYLKHEVAEYPLKVALNELKGIGSTLFGTQVFGHYQDFVKNIIEPIFTREQFNNIAKEPEYDILKNELETLIVELSCNFGVKNCIDQVRRFFQEWSSKDDPMSGNPIPERLFKFVFCQVVKNSSENGKEWNFVYKWYLDEYMNNEVGEISDLIGSILPALGCSKRTDQLEECLSIIYEHDLPAEYSFPIIDSLASHEAGYFQMKKFFLSKIDAMVEDLETYKVIIGHILVKLFEFTNTRDDYNNLKGIMNLIGPHLRDVENLLKENTKKAKRNILWRQKHEKTITEYFTLANTPESLTSDDTTNIMDKRSDDPMDIV